MLGKVSEIINGFILLSFPGQCRRIYTGGAPWNENVKSPGYMMPIFESPSLVNPRDRYDILYKLKEKLDQAEELVLNIRVGGNDLCNVFDFGGTAMSLSIKSIRSRAFFPISLPCMEGDYVVSGPVWNNITTARLGKGFGRSWRTTGCGFVGKTVIHPEQIELVNEAYQVSREDFDDARQILGWDADSRFQVAGSSASERMK